MAPSSVTSSVIWDGIERSEFGPNVDCYELLFDSGWNLVSVLFPRSDLRTESRCVWNASIEILSAECF